MRRLTLFALALCAAALPRTPLAAQGLRGQIADLFSFGECGKPLCLDGSVNAQNGHGEHFLNSVADANSSVVSFMTDAIGLSLTNIPLSATSSGAAFTFVEGMPVRSAASSGPVFGERAQTLGRGRVLLGLTVSSLNFTTLRGLPIRDLSFNFTHQDVGLPGLGDVTFENDVLNVRTSLDVNVLVTSALVTVGLTDHVDLSVAVPYVYTTLAGHSIGQLQPFGAGAPHFFSGTSTSPVIRATASVDGEANGIGDVAARLKFNLSQSHAFGLSMVADARFPTGDEDDLLGTGALAIRALTVLSAQRGSFGPHLNVGYLRRGSSRHSNAWLATVGFDQMLSPWATIAAEVMTENQIGGNKLQLPGPVEYVTPYRRFVNPTEIPNSRDNIVNASFGAKFTTQNGVRLVVNGIFPIARAGLQPDAIWTSGLEYTF